MYSLGAVLTQTPEKVKQTVLSVAGAGVIFATARGYTVDGAFVAAVGIAVERLLDLFYVAPVRNAQTEITTLKGIELGKTLGPDVAPVAPVAPPAQAQ